MDTLLAIVFVSGFGLVSMLLPAGPMFTQAEEARRERRRNKRK